MKQLPNLLKQESSSAATLINVLLRMYRDPRDAHRATRSGVLERLVPYVLSSSFFIYHFVVVMVLIDRLAVEVIKDFIALDPETQPRNVTAWTPVVTDVLRGSIEFEEDQVSFPSSQTLPYDGDRVTLMGIDVKKKEC
jgi:brefeldin A-inhibited guanine nucleotide-exchange protein